MAELSDGQALGLLNKVVFVLKRRETLQDRHDPIKGTEGLLLVGPQCGVGLAIAQGMQTAGVDGAARAAVQDDLRRHGPNPTWIAQLGLDLSNG
jgi:hypothetical protein